MDRRFAAFLISLAAPFSAFAQDSPPPGPVDDPGLPRRFQDGERRGHRDKDGDRPDWLKRKLDRMSPEERKRILENYEKWKNLPPEEREKLSEKWKKLPPEEREKLRKLGHRDRGEFIRRAVAEALEKTGLKLSPEDQEAFAIRYREERRKLEEKLREELERKRQEQLPEMLERLKSEFSSRNQSPPATPSPTPSASSAGTGS